MNSSVSVVVPCYNAAPFLRETLDSALNQTHPALEVIVVDDGSMDDSAEVVRSFGPQVELHRFEVNRGKPVVLNWGIPRTTGKYIMVLDADDILKPFALERLRGFLDRHPEIGVAFGHSEMYSGDTMLAERHPITEPVKAVSAHYEGPWLLFDQDAFFDATLRHSYCPTSSTLFRRSCLDTVGLYNEQCPSGQDWEILVRLARRFRFAFLDVVLSRKREHDHNLSSAECFAPARLRGQTRGRERILQTVDLTPDQRAFLQQFVIARKRAWARGLLRKFRSSEARELYRELRAERAFKPLDIPWLCVAHLPLSIIRFLWNIKQLAYRKSAV